MNPITQICAGTQYADVNRLDWLTALVADYTERTQGQVDEDPQATATMLNEVQGLLNDLRAAVKAEVSR